MMEARARALSMHELSELKRILNVKKTRNNWLKKIGAGKFANVYKFQVKRNRGGGGGEHFLFALFSRVVCLFVFVVVFVVCICLQFVCLLFVVGFFYCLYFCSLFVCCCYFLLFVFVCFYCNLFVCYFLFAICLFVI